MSIDANGCPYIGICWHGTHGQALVVAIPTKAMNKSLSLFLIRLCPLVFFGSLSFSICLKKKFKSCIEGGDSAYPISNEDKQYTTRALLNLI